MAGTKELRSRVIDGLKVLLPLAALTMLSVLFLFSRKSDPELAVPFAEALATGETARQHVGAPRYTGVTGKGEALTMTAARVRLDEADDRLLAEDLAAELTLSDGSRVTLVAPQTHIDEAANLAEMTGGVQIDGSAGYQLTTPGLTADTGTLVMESTGPVAGTTPAGALTAGRMRIASDDSGAPVQMHFTQGVKLVYHPKGE